MVKIIYATVTGNTETVVKHVESRLKGGGVSEIELIRGEAFEAEHFSNEDKYIVAASTWNLGEMNQFLEHIFEDLPKTDMKGVNMAFIGLGDKIYGEENFCMSVKSFKEVALKQGAVEIIDPLYIDGEPESQLDTVVDEWTDKLLEKLK